MPVLVSKNIIFWIEINTCHNVAKNKYFYFEMYIHKRILEKKKSVSTQKISNIDDKKCFLGSKSAY